MYANDGVVAVPSPPAVIVLDSNLGLVSWTPGARGWIDALPSASLFARFGMLPSVVYPAATLARSGRPAAGAHALLRAVDGRWVMIEAAPLEGEGNGEIAITLRPATASETFALLCRAYALTWRERDVVAAVLAGLDTRAVTERLFISRHTVQDHLKSVFEKIGIHSRRELLATFNPFAPEPADKPEAGGVSSPYFVTAGCCAGDERAPDRPAIVRLLGSADPLFASRGQGLGRHVGRQPLNESVRGAELPSTETTRIAHEVPMLNARRSPSGDQAPASRAPSATSWRAPPGLAT
jgi:DNA-binding CsgD family transcriptional regulator